MIASKVTILSTNNLYTVIWKTDVGPLLRLNYIYIYIYIYITDNEYISIINY